MSIQIMHDAMMDSQHLISLYKARYGSRWREEIVREGILIEDECLYDPHKSTVETDNYTNQERREDPR